MDGVLYCNDGDWVESCTALAEDETGALSLITWHQFSWEREASEKSNAGGGRKQRVLTAA